MSEEKEKQHEQTEKTASRKFLDEIINDLPYAKPIRKFIHREGKAIYDGFIVFGILASLLAWYAFSKGYGFGAKKLESVQGELKDAKQDRDKFQGMLAPFQAMAIKIYTNVPTDKRLDALADQFISVSSNLEAMVQSERPSFEFYINNGLVTNGSIVSLKENRRFSLKVGNISSVTADQLSVELLAPVAFATNLICDSSWMLQPEFTAGWTDGGFDKTVRFNHWRWTSDKTVASGFGYLPSYLEISTNFTSPVIVVDFVVYANRSKTQIYRVSLTF